MIRSEFDQATDLLVQVAGWLSGLPPLATTSAAADLRRLTGAVSAEASAILRSGTLSSRVMACFQAAQAAGVGFDRFASLRAQIVAAAATGRPAQIVRQDAARRCLVQMARALIAMDFKTREAVVSAQNTVNAAFGEAEEQMLSTQDTDTYRAIVTLHAAVTRDLTSRARPLPRIVTITTATPVPALVLAQRLYGDAGRADELVASNDAMSPLFMPQTIQALSA